jgi:hypothetical protein
MTNHLFKLFSLASIEFNLQEKKHRLKEIMRLACFWHWQLTRISNSKLNDVAFYYFGRKFEREGAISLLGLNDLNTPTLSIKTNALVSEFPIPSAICLPLYLTTVIQLESRTLNDILMRLQKEKRRLINSQASNYKLKKVTTVEDVIRLDQEMLRPFANARYGRGAYNLPLQQLIEMTFNTGHFYLLLHKGEEVGCFIGHFSERNKKRYWQVDRMGFPEAIYSNMQPYREKNVMLFYLQIEWAIINGFEYYDMGANCANAEVGVLHYKRTYGGELSVMGNYSYLYLKIPSAYAARFYWEKPLFALEGKAVVLHLGVPDGVSELELLNRYKLLNFGGLAKVYLHYETKPPENAIEIIRRVFNQQKPPYLLAS